MTDEIAQRQRDAEEHQASYDAIMRVGTEVGVPFSLALTMFFTQLVLANGILMAALSGVVVYIFSHLVVKMFFSH